MEEELNEHDLEERLYAMLHHVDETQNNLTGNHSDKFDIVNFVDNIPRSTVRRYWRVGADTNPYQKVNTPKDPAAPALGSKPSLTQDNNRPKEEKSASPKPSSPVDLSILQSAIPQNAHKTIEFLDHEEDNPVVLESSDEDEVVEVALPPKPTITIESSDEDELHIVKPNSEPKTDTKTNSEQKLSDGERAESSSPVPSVVSSVSDEFIRGDCIALNISSSRPDKHSFDFSLHGSDLLVQNTPPKKKKRKKNKEAVTSTPVNTPISKSAIVADGCFATPKSKAKNKKQKSKLVTEKSIPNLDVFDSESNQFIDTNTIKKSYIVTEKSLPSADVYESDSNQSEIVREITDGSKKKDVCEAYSSSSIISSDKLEKTISKKNNSLHDSSFETVDLTYSDKFITLDQTGISESIVMANVTGFTELQNQGEKNQPLSSKTDISKYVSSKVPSILNEDLDFDNLKGIEKICKKRRYSLTSLRAEMEKFYNESWGGEDFNHREIQKNMSRDKSLWAIDPKDRMPTMAQRKSKCNYCNRVGHRDDTCRQKPAICYMCGNAGHFEPRCPTKICVNCGAPNFMYSTMCRNCSTWPTLLCAECGQRGHPASHCPDVWRRYHNTIETDTPLEQCNGSKKHYQLYCSGCSRRGHLVHSCRVTLPFSGFSINSPFVRYYRPLYRPTANQNTNQNQRSKSFSQDTTSPRTDRNKRLSKSPTFHEGHVNKKRNLSLDDAERRAKSPGLQKNVPPTAESTPKNKSKSKSLDSSAPVATEKMPDFISISSSNRDNEGHMIQDNEVSDTSDVVTSARIYVTDDIIKKLDTKEGEVWLKVTVEKLSVVVGNADVNSFLTIKGKLADQEAFQAQLREWTQNDTNKPKSNNADVSASEESNNLSGHHNLPKNRNNLLRQLNKALDSLKENFGDPKVLYRKLTFFQSKHAKLLKQKVISPKTLSHSRAHINETLKKLNIILLGQSGLADGTVHINELQSFKEKLMNSRQKTISPSLRKEIGDHYHCVFSSSARDDYTELVRKYYLSNSKVKRAKRKRRNKSDKPNPNTPELSKADSIPSKEIIEKLAPKPSGQSDGEKCNTINTAKLLRNLIDCRARLNSLQHSGEMSKQKRNMINQIMRRVHPFIVILFKKENISSKMLKKIMKAQETARKFLANV